MGRLSDKVEHVVVLMLENRSFDSILGTLYPKSPRFDGLSGNESNPLQGGDAIRVWNSGGFGQDAMSIPATDPKELWDDINMQIFGLDGKPGDQAPPMDGFANNYASQPPPSPDKHFPQSIMHYYAGEQVPVISTLAKQFAVCDQWFASAPCQTWPNRFFLHTGTAAGYENNSPIHPPYLMDTIFNRLSEAGKGWTIYFHDFPQTLALAKLWEHFSHFQTFGKFIEDAGKGELPAYSFIEPRYFPELKLPNDQHPPCHVGMGEELVADVYNALRGSSVWEKSMLIILYDEHGGMYDHAPPPLAIPPDGTGPQPFGFGRYGVRVPAVIVSPYIRPGTVLRATGEGGLPHNGPPYPFDHTSVIATLRKCFGLGAPLTRRDAVAPDLESALNLDTPSNLGPAKITPRPYTVPPDTLAAALSAPLNGFQKALHGMAAYLPPLGTVTGLENILTTIEKHVENLLNGDMPKVPDHQTQAEATQFIQGKLTDFWGHDGPETAIPPKSPARLALSAWFAVFVSWFRGIWDTYRNH